jgi:hypothetical protein
MIFLTPTTGNHSSGQVSHCPDKKPEQPMKIPHRASSELKVDVETPMPFYIFNFFKPAFEPQTPVGIQRLCFSKTTPFCPKNFSVTALS